MFYIKSLTFNGIRCFPQGSSSEILFENDQHLISIFRGLNGTGKTTIVEILKFALTGNYPHSPDQLKSFLRDPIFHGAKSSIGNIHLCLVEDTTIEWDIIWTLTSTKVTSCKIMKGNQQIYSSNPRNKTQEKEIAVRIAEIFEINPSVWESVIMCPQEEVNWPFTEPGKLKGLLDSMYGLKEENKKLGQLSQRKAELSAEKEKMKPELRDTKARSTQYKEKENNLNSKVSLRTQVHNEIMRISQEKSQIEEKLDEITKAKQILEKLQQYETNFKNSDPKLTEQIQNLDLAGIMKTIQDTELEIQTVSGKIVKLEADKSVNQDEASNLNSILGGLRAGKGIIAETSEKINSLLTRLELEGEIDKEVIRNKIQSRIHELENDLVTMKQNVKNAQSLMNKLTEEETKRSGYSEQLSILNTEMSSRTFSQTQKEEAGDFVKIPTDLWNSLMEFITVYEKEKENLENSRNKIPSGGKNLEERIEELDTTILERKTVESKLEVFQAFESKENEIPGYCPLCSAKDPAAVLSAMSFLKDQSNILSEKLNNLRTYDTLKQERGKLKELLFKEKVQETMGLLISQINKLSPAPSAPDDTINTETNEPTLDGRCRKYQNRFRSSEKRTRDIKQELTQSFVADFGFEQTEAENNYIGILTKLDSTKISPLQNELQNLQRDETELQKMWEIVGMGLGVCNLNIASCEESINSKKDEIDMQNREIQDARNKMTNLQVTLADLNLKSSNRTIYEDFIKKQKELQDLRNGDSSKFQSLNEIAIQMNAVQEELAEKTTEQENSKAKNSILEGEINMLQMEMNSNRLKTAVAEYENCLQRSIDLQNNLTQVETGYADLRKKILDTNNSKTEQINQAFKEKWTRLYGRDDLTSIKLTAVKLKADGVKRVAYDYHFEIIVPPGAAQNDNVLKMRGRSSLGEKYLASVVIRCTLAELFAPKWPIFGFDALEANLDEGVSNRLIQLFAKLSKENKKQLLITSPTPEFAERVRLDCGNCRLYILEKNAQTWASTITEQGQF